MTLCVCVCVCVHICVCVAVCIEECLVKQTSSLTQIWQDVSAVYAWRQLVYCVSAITLSPK